MRTQIGYYTALSAWQTTAPSCRWGYSLSCIYAVGGLTPPSYPYTPFQWLMTVDYAGAGGQGGGNRAAGGLRACREGGHHSSGGGVRHLRHWHLYQPGGVSSPPLSVSTLVQGIPYTIRRPSCGVVRPPVVALLTSPAP